MTTCADVLDRRLEIYQKLHEALRLSSGKIVIRDVFPEGNDRRIAARIVKSDPKLKYCLKGPYSSGVAARIGATVMLPVSAFPMSQRRKDISDRLSCALESNGGAVVVHSVFPITNDRKLAHCIANSDPALQYISSGATISVINGEQPQPE